METEEKFNKVYLEIVNDNNIKDMENARKGAIKEKIDDILFLPVTIFIIIILICIGLQLHISLSITGTISCLLGMSLISFACKGGRRSNLQKG